MIHIILQNNILTKAIIYFYIKHYFIQNVKAVTRLQDINVLNNICDDFSNFYCIIAINSNENITVPNDRIDWWCEANLVNFAGLKLVYTD